MLTPEILDKYTYNRVVKLYDQLTIDICSSMINRIDRLGDISESSKYEIRQLLKINGKEVFYEALDKTSKLDSKTKKAIKDIYEQMIKENMQGFKYLYAYKDMPFKLTPTQLKLLNTAIKRTDKEIKNFTKSIAFNSQQSFINTVDKAYLQVATGSIDYNTAIYNAYKEIAQNGLKITSQTSGRQYNVDVAVRQNVLTGLQQTASDINISIGDYLGTDGWETTVSRNSRPTHAVWQGKQFAIKHDTKESKKYPLWTSKIEDELSEPNCQHDKFPILLGVSEPVYTKKELNKINQKTVRYNGKSMPVYEAQQEMRYIERNIRSYKRQVDILKKSGKDYSKENNLLKSWRTRYTDFTKQTGLDKENDRVRI